MTSSISISWDTRSTLSRVPDKPHDNTEEVDMLLPPASVKEPSTFEETISSPQSASCSVARDKELPYLQEDHEIIKFVRKKYHQITISLALDGSSSFKLTGNVRLALSFEARRKNKARPVGHLWSKRERLQASRSFCLLQ